MHFQYLVGPPTGAIAAPPPLPADNHTEQLLRELITVSRDQLSYARAAYEQQNNNQRWQHFLARWAEDYPVLGEQCQKALPMIERAFVQLLDDLTESVVSDGQALRGEFNLSEFLDRYGTRLSQLGTMLNMLGPIVEAARNSPQS